MIERFKQRWLMYNMNLLREKKNKTDYEIELLARWEKHPNAKSWW